MTGLVLTPLARALARRLERGSAGSANADVEALRSELGEFRTRVEAVEQVAARLEELEERLDFTERVLVKGREREALPGGG